MRVVRTEGSDRDGWIPRLCTHRGQSYAILSHRWLQDPNHEVLFADIEEIDRSTNEATVMASTDVIRNAQYAGLVPSLKPGFKKLRGTAQQALRDGYDYVWVDTCCIDKNSSAELSEAINSMWMWYKASSICYVYLADMPDVIGEEQVMRFGNSQWWRRGWTLQELLAPQKLVFYSSSWAVLGHKQNMDLRISEITGIEPNVINGTISFESFSIAQRMSWASGRITTRIEDMAYSLIGLFGVNMPLLYGEGERAFLRLQQEIMKDSDDETIFAWRDKNMPPTASSGLLAGNPSLFASNGKTVRFSDTGLRAPYSMTNKGLSITLKLIPTGGETFDAILHCTDSTIRPGHLVIHLKRVSGAGEQYARIYCSNFASRDYLSVQDRSTDGFRTIHVKQVVDQGRGYGQLNRPHRSIRILRILPSEGDTLLIELMGADVETSRYTALSYAWDDSTPTREIFVNGEQFLVQRKISDFLQAASRARKTEYFWVSSICVRLKSDEERLQHAAIAGKIFGCATKVVIWLHKVQTNDKALEKLHLLGELLVRGLQAPHFEIESRDPGVVRDTKVKAKEFGDKLPALYNIAADPYWAQIHAVSELLPAREVVVRAESLKIDLEKLKRIYCVSLLVTQQYGLENLEPMLHMGRLLRISSTDQHSYASVAAASAVLKSKPKSKVPMSQASDEVLVDLHALIKISHSAATKERSQSRGDVANTLLDLKQKSQRKPPKLETLLSDLPSQASHDEEADLYSLISISDFAGGLEIDHEKNAVEVFLEVATGLGNDLTSTILPALVRFLRIPMRYGHDYFDTSSFFQYLFTKYSNQFHLDPTVYSIEDPTTQTGKPSVPPIPDASLAGDAPAFLTIEDNSVPGGGLILVGESDRTLYKPAYLYIRGESGKCTSVIIPVEMNRALKSTYGSIDRFSKPPFRFRIAADSKGLLALAFCMRTEGLSLPLIFEAPFVKSLPVMRESMSDHPKPTLSRIKDRIPLFRGSVYGSS